jgi:predicted P-loop ATPase
MSDDPNAKIREIVAGAEPFAGDADGGTDCRHQFNGRSDKTEWKTDLLCNEDGKAKSVFANALHALRYAPEWRGVLAYNDFANMTEMVGPPPWHARSSSWSPRAWSDTDDHLCTEWFQVEGIMVTQKVVGPAVETVARENSFHPVRDYLESLVWDGVTRLGDLLPTYFGADATRYHCAVGSRWMISAVARVFRPGCKADCMLVLEGNQGTGKSTGLKVLAGDWFTDRLSDLKNKDALIELSGAWIIEIAELDALNRSDSGTIKAFLSRMTDRYRPPYGKRIAEAPRQCAFAGTVNPEGGYLHDVTGARRFWPARCGLIDLDSLARDRDQLWAEAHHRFKKGEPWWLTPELEEIAREHQAARAKEDPWKGPIAEYLSHRETHDDPTVGEILEKALEKKKGDWTNWDETRVARCLKSLGYERYRACLGGGAREWRYRQVGAMPGVGHD